MKFVPTAVTKKFARQILITKKNSPQLMFVAGVTGVVAASVLACRATLQLDEVLERTNADVKLVGKIEHGDYDETDRVKDKAYIYSRSALTIGKLYAPAVVVGGISIGMLAGSHRTLTKRNVALTAAYAAVEKGWDEYRERVVADLGEEKDLEYRYPLEECEISEEKDGKSVKRTVKAVTAQSATVYARFFDELNRNWSPAPDYNKIFLNCQQNYANDLLRTRGHVFLNEVYDMLGMERTSAGAVVGWVISKDGPGDNFIDFGIYNHDSERARMFVNGTEAAILLDFNVDGVIYDKI